MSKRNLAWLVVVFGTTVLVGVAVGWLSGVFAGATVLLVSELYERDRRRRRRAAQGDDGARPLRDTVDRRRS